MEDDYNSTTETLPGGRHAYSPNLVGHTRNFPGQSFGGPSETVQTQISLKSLHQYLQNEPIEDVRMVTRKEEL